MQDPKKDLHACQSFLTVVLEAIILAAFAAKWNVANIESADITSILRQELPQSPKERLDCITQLASKVVDLVVVCPTDSLQTSQNNDDVSSYMSNVLGMGLFAWDMEDAIREGDGERMIRLWKFLLLLFKQAGKTKYSLEAMHLLFDVTVALSKKRSHELTWNRTCNTHGGIGCNKPLDLHLEHMNRNFKDDISKFAPHLTESSVQKTAHASPVVAECVAQLDKLIHIKRDSGYHAEPLHDQDRKAIFQQLVAAKACHYVPGRAYTHFQGISSHLYRKIREDTAWEHFTDWIDRTVKKFTMELQYKDYVKSKDK